MRYLALKRGVTLIEITVAIFVLGAAAIPMIGLFTGYYDTSTRQLEQDMALKIGESTINYLMNRKYSDLSESKLTTESIDINTNSGTVPLKLIFNGPSSSATQLKLGRITYSVEASISKAFRGQSIASPHDQAAVFQYLDMRSSSPSPKSYSSFDDLIAIKVTVGYGGTVPVVLSTFRADMVR
jgi:prepilin-type N-terminal cleavage/methylation domain-containing protein